MLLTVRAVLPMLVSVSAIAALEVPRSVVRNTTLDADNFTCVPVPVRVIDCGLPLAVSVIVTVPLRTPLAVGWNLTLMIHSAATAKELPQVLLCAKSPLAAMLVILNAAVPSFLSSMD
jgi:hypothetical protein